MPSSLTHPFLEYPQRQGAQSLPRLSSRIHPLLPAHPEWNKWRWVLAKCVKDY